MKKIIVPVVIIICLCVAGFGVWKVLESQVLSPEELPSNTTINGIDCSGLTPAEAQEKLTNAWNKQTLKVKKGNKTIAKFTDFDLNYSIDNSLNTIKKDHFLRAVMNHYFGSEFNTTINMEVSQINPAFAERVRKNPAFQQINPTITKDATIDLSSQDFPIIPEVYGNNLDYKLLAKNMVKRIEAGTMDFPYVEDQYYAKPKVTADSQEIIERQEFCKEYLTSKVTYKFGSEEVPIPPVDLDKMLTVKYPKSEEEDIQVTVNKKAVKSYVKRLAKKYDTVGVKRTFTSIRGAKVVVQGGDYGYAIDVKKETARLIKDLNGAKKATREPIWLQKGWGEYDKNNDLGNTYVEISLGAQHLWYYKNGKQIVECPVVTGSVALGMTTPAGTYDLTFKENGATLKGYNPDGTTYESPVSYWMPFYGNYGMHDAPWRGAFGGSIYQSNGSHGCVNMPVGSAAKLFRNLASSGTPVVVHY